MAGRIQPLRFGGRVAREYRQQRRPPAGQGGGNQPVIRQKAGRQHQHRARFTDKFGGQRVGRLHAHHACILRKACAKIRRQRGRHHQHPLGTGLQHHAGLPFQQADPAHLSKPGRFGTVQAFAHHQKRYEIHARVLNGAVAGLPACPRFCEGLPR